VKGGIFMKKLQSFFLSKIINKRVYDEYGDYIGKLIDIYVTSEDAYPRAIAYKIMSLKIFLFMMMRVKLL